MKTIHDIVKLGPVIPVLAFETVEQGEHVSRALHAGGVKVLEITLRTEAGLKAIERASQLADDIVVGVGHHHASRALRPGQEGRRAVRRLAGPDARHAPGRQGRGPAAAARRDDADRHHRAALELGYEVVKFFPAQQAGGIPMLQAFHGPFPTLKFCPTGGISAQSAPDFLKQPNVVCVGGSWLTPKAALAAQDWAEVTRLAQAASQLPR